MREVAGHREEPRRERARGVVAADALGHLHPRLLERVLGHGLVSHEPQQVAEEAVLVPAHQPGEPGGVAPAEPCGVVPVRIHRPSLSLRLFYSHYGPAARKDAGAGAQRAGASGPPSSDTPLHRRLTVSSGGV